MTAYARPLLCWLVTLSGLVMALVSEGVGDALGLVLLALPLVPVLAALSSLRRSPRHPRQRDL